MLTFPSNHVNLVTGASTGIGAATAISLAQSGSAIAVHFNRSESEAKRVVNQILAAGGKASAFQADLAGNSASHIVGEAIEINGGMWMD